LKKLKVGVVGCGGIATGKHLPALSRNKNVEVVAFCDIIESKAIEACEKFGAEGAKVYVDYKELLKDSLIDTVHVCTPNKSHSFISIDAMEAGKHVLCEKPMAKTYKEAMEMVEASERTGKLLTIGYQNRQTPDARYLHDVCESGELGDIYFSKAHAIRRRGVPTWGVFLNEDEQGGGPLIDIGTHALDMTLWMMDNYEPLYVVGNTYKELADTENAANAFGSWNVDEYNVETSAFGFITMKNGATIVLESSWALNITDTAEAKSTLCGTKGGATMKGELIINGEQNSRLYEKKIDLKEGGVAFFEGEGAGASEDIELQIFVNAILNGTELCVKPRQAAVVTQILEAIYESSKTKKPVYLG